MKSLLSYYYGINTNNIVRKGSNYFFKINNNNYVFFKLKSDKYMQSYLYKFDMELLNYNKLFHQIILNKYNSFTTPVDNKLYVLFKINIINNRLISINDIFEFSAIGYVPQKINDQFNSSDWVKLWRDKINYFEYYNDNIKDKNYFFKELINYFVGLGENAIIYVQDTLKLVTVFNNNLVIQHKRIGYKDTLLDLYNPLNIVFDNRVRDISEYFKSILINGNYKKEWLKQNIDRFNFNEIESRLFFGRLLFPSSFFDEYEYFVNKEISEHELLAIIDQIERYEKYINDIYMIISLKYNIPKVDWICR